MAASKFTHNFPAAENAADENTHEVKWLYAYVQALVNSALCYSLLLDSEMKILYHSDSVRNLAGMGEGETLVGRSAQEVYRLVYDENLYPGALRRLKRAQAGEEYFFENDTIVWPTGERRLYQINYQKITSTTDNFEGVLMYAQDITDLRLEDAKRRVDTLLHSSVLPCYVWDENGDVIAYNREAARTFGVLPDMTPHDFGALMVSSLQPEFQPCGRETESVRRALVHEALQNGFAETEGFLQTRDASPLYVRATILRTAWPFGFRLIVYIQDKTGSYLQEKEVEHIREQNERQLAKLNLVVKASGVGLWSVEIDADNPANPDGAATFSGEFRQLLGFSDEQDFPDQFGSWISRLHPDDKENTLMQFRKHVFDTSGRTPYSAEHRLLKKDGQYGYYRAYGETERDDKGRPIRMFGALRDITQEKTTLSETEKQREELERVRDLMLKASKVGLWNLDFVRSDARSSIVAAWSDEFRKMLGFTDEKDFPSVLDSWANQLHPDDKESAINHLKKHMLDTSGQMPYDSEFRLLKKNGQYGYYRSFGETLRDADGRILHMSGALMDITEAKNHLYSTEQKSVELKRIREQNEFQLARLKLVVQASGVGLWDMVVMRGDPMNPANIFTWSNEFRHMLGFTSERDFPNVLGSWSDRLHPDDKERTLDLIIKHLSDTTGKTPFDTEYRLLRKDGQYGYFRASGSTFRDDDGNPLRIVGALMDITEAKNLLLTAEMQRIVAEASEERARVMLNSTPMMCILQDVNGAIADCNEEAVKVLGLTSKAELMQDFYRFYPEYQEDGVRTTDRMKEVLQFLDTAEKPFYQLERTFQTSAGEIVPVESTIVRIPRQEGHYYLSFSRDLREIKAQERELEEIREEKNRAEIQREAALAANEAKSVFLATMSHEIRTPMNAVMGMVEILLAENLNERQLQHVRDIRTSALALLDVVNDILDLSKIQVGKLKTEAKHYDFTMLIDNLSAMAYFLVSRKSITFNLLMSESTPVYLYGDEVRLRQAILNLLSNAIKFTDDGSVDLIVTFTETTVKITVRDTGIGILPEEIPKLFEPFEQVDTSRVRRDEGTGLGLSITKAIIELMDGQLTVESVYGQGSSFHIEVPKILGDETQVVNEDTTQGMLHAPEAKMLVVDDNLANLKVAAGLLQLFQITAETVSSGRDAIKMVWENDYDLVLMDYRMPGMDGVEAALEIRKLGLSVPIIGCTASVTPETKEKLMDAGMNDFLAKPITKVELKHILKKWIPAEKVTETIDDGFTFGDTEDDSYRIFWEKLQNIEGLSISAGLERVGGQRDVYEETLKLMLREIEKSMTNLSEFLGEGDLQNFAVEVHSIRGSLASIGAMELSGKARELEHASDRQDTSFCFANLPLLEEGLLSLRERLQAAFAEISHDEEPVTVPEELVPVFEEILLAMDEMDLMQISREMDSLEAFSAQGALKEKIEGVKYAVMMMDYAAAAELIQDLLNKKE